MFFWATSFSLTPLRFFGDLILLNLFAIETKTERFQRVPPVFVAVCSILLFMVHFRVDFDLSLSVLS